MMFADLPIRLPIVTPAGCYTVVITRLSLVTALSNNLYRYLCIWKSSELIGTHRNWTYAIYI